MQRYQQADAAAASRLAEQLSGRLCGYFVAQVRDRHHAEDLFQECWLRIHKSRHLYRPEEPLLPWVFAIARRVQADHYRRGQRIARYELQKEHVEDIPGPGEASLATLNILGLLQTLPINQRETVMLLKVTGLTLEEVSRVTGVSVGAVKQRAHRAYASLRRLLGGKRWTAGT